MSAPLAGRVAVVSGGAGGIGAAVVRRLAAAGARVASLDLVVPSAEEETAAALRLVADVADAAAVDRAFAKVARALGGADLLVTCAGIGTLAPFLETTAEQLDRMHAVNVRGTFLCAQAAARQMRARGGGRIVTVSSISGRRGNALRTAYAASKAAIVAMTEVMAVELAPWGILVNAVAPGPVETQLVAAMQQGAGREAWRARVPLARFAAPEEIAGAVLFLCGPDASFITGHTLHVDGGFLACGMPPPAPA